MVTLHLGPIYRALQKLACLTTEGSGIIGSYKSNAGDSSYMPLHVWIIRSFFRVLRFSDPQMPSQACGPQWPFVIGKHA